MITGMGNAQVKRIISLLQKSKLRRSEGVYIVEGVRMFLEAPLEHIKEIYVSKSFLDKANKQSIEKLKAMRYETVSDDVFRKMSDTQTPQGVLCVMEMPAYSLDGMLKNAGSAPFFMLLEDIQDPGNLGTIFRAGEGAGIDGVIMTGNTVDVFNPKVVRSTMGSIYRVPFLTGQDIARTVSALREHGVAVYAAHLDESGDYAACDYARASAFLIGNEARGLKRETAGLADRCIKIPMKGQVESLNAATAAAVLMYEAARQRRYA